MRQGISGARLRAVALTTVAVAATLGALASGIALRPDWAIRLAGLGIGALSLQMLLGVIHRSPKTGTGTAHASTDELVDPAESGPARHYTVVDDFAALEREADAEADRLHEPVAIEDVLRLAVDSARPSAAARGQRLVVATALSGAQVSGYPAHLDRAVGTLLTRALRSTPSDGTITVDAHLERGSVTLSVDAGAPRDDADARTLAAVRNIATRHGGELTVDGARVTVRLPTLATAAA